MPNGHFHYNKVKRFAQKLPSEDVITLEIISKGNGIILVFLLDEIIFFYFCQAFLLGDFTETN